MPKTATQSDNPSMPTPRHASAPEKAGAGSIHIAKPLEAPAVTVEMPRPRSGEWFQRIQKEAIGILEPESKADGRMRNL